MKFDILFLRDEVRNGFYIPTAIKQCFAAQMSVLNEIDIICNKHNIQYFADWGTLLAAVRHGGYIPWDDDLDICMKRADYEKFMEVAYKELPSHYDIHTYKTKENHWLFITKILGTSHICFDPDYLTDNNNFPYIPCVDIFLIDNLYKDADKEKERDKDILHILSVADSIIDNKLSAKDTSRLLSEIEKSHNITIDHSLDSRHIGICLYSLVEKRMAEASDEDAGNVGQIFPWVLNGGTGYPKEYYKDFSRLPFENITIPVPCGYNKALTLHYGNYLAINREHGAHTYPFFEAQKSNLLANADFEFPEFKFDEKYVKRISPDKSHSLKNTIIQSINDINSCHKIIEKLSGIDSAKEDANSRIEEIIALLANCQEIAINVGTLIENINGEGTQLVHILESYCEELFVVNSQLLSNNAYSTDMLNDTIKEFKLLFEREILNRRFVVFFTITPEWWNEFDSLYRKEALDNNTTVFVVPLPTYKKDAYGRTMYTGSFDLESDTNGANVHITSQLDPYLVDYKLTDYPEDITLYDFQKLDLSRIMPDTIYFQEASDNENPCYCIPRSFYSDELQKYTDNLIYVFPFRIAEFNSDDYCENYNLKHYLYKPGILRADTIYVHSDSIKDIFIKNLTNFSNGKHNEIWAEKICKLDMTNCSRNNDLSQNKKSVLYCIGENELAESANSLSLVKNRLDIFKNHSDEITTFICFYPFKESLWSDRSKPFISQIETYINDCDCESLILLNNDCDINLVNSCSAYYGAPSPYVRHFIDNRKPVMIESND